MFSEKFTSEQLLEWLKLKLGSEINLQSFVGEKFTSEQLLEWLKLKLGSEINLQSFVGEYQITIVFIM